MVVSILWAFVNPIFIVSDLWQSDRNNFKSHGISGSICVNISISRDRREILAIRFGEKATTRTVYRQ